tara:strand:- start:4174 stop:4533 length:360 start_codon:yes stop_codon:yes gene_type:complete
MPLYVFECYEEDGGCGRAFEIKTTMDKISSTHPSCPSCRKRKSVARNFHTDITVFDAAPKTVGTLAERNVSRLSKDERIAITKEHNEYRDKPFTGSLPKGGSLYPVDSQGQKVPRQRKT